MQLLQFGRFKVRLLSVLLPGLLWMLAGSTLWMAVKTAGAAARRAGDSHDIARLTTNLEDLEVTIHVTKFEPKELEKIGPDFGISYRLRNLVLQYKQPGKIRLAGRSVTLGEALLILNGSQRFYSVPRLGMKRTEDLENAPSKRQSLLEYGGVLSADTLHFMRARFVRQEMLDNCLTSVFDLTYLSAENSSHYRVWIDPKTRITLKREWYNSKNDLRATFYYKEPQEVAPGIWLPSVAEIKNAEGAVAAATTYNDVKINQGLSESLFAIAP